MNREQPTEERLRCIDVHELLPQREPFVMVSRLLHYDPRLTVCETDIAADNLFLRDGALSESGLLEVIAQTCACRIGYINKYILRRGVQTGYLGAVKRMHIDKLPVAGSRIRTTIEVIEEVFGTMLSSAKIECEESVIAEAEIKMTVNDG